MRNLLPYQWHNTLECAFESICFRSPVVDRPAGLQHAVTMYTVPIGQGSMALVIECSQGNCDGLRASPIRVATQ